ncbi:protein ENHANCED DISEASE RESISTANCE 2 [Selaginella moellendorffii]|uniref:protein ENHANCED DISEASE RESISTANCE 2 n=1 Tax=Selaginella moellendorffii TaxID=88036 RepID=UPI000D1C5F7F|nr:protein ENHANCED DISEASE RESISTANCE 2 [Selaginella moellendorffii]|eukprot:XP_024522558.1 protein ENHANCED DISEASE RESISTANCE 2 [Selaginella moellendorffii]
MAQAQAYAGWVYHVGINSKDLQYCHARYLVIKGRCVDMYKRDPQEEPGLQPMKKGIVRHNLMVAEIGRQIVYGRVLYGMKIHSKRDHSKHVQFACSSAEEIEKWMSAFRHAKDEAELEARKTSARAPSLTEEESKQTLPRMRSKSRLSRLITIGKGPEMLMRARTSMIQEADTDDYFNKRDGDAVEQADWRCFQTQNGLRMFEDVAALQADRGTIMKSVGVVDASPDAVFEIVMSLDKSQRHQWDVLTGDLELVEHIDGHADIVYGTFDPKYFENWSWYRKYKRRDFLISRYWRRDQDGSYSITQISTLHRNRPKRPGLRRVVLNSGIWEINPLPTRSGTTGSRSLVTQVMEIESTGWGRWRKSWGKWKKSDYSSFRKTVPYILLCRTAGLREFFKAEAELSLLEDRISVLNVPKEAAKPLETAADTEVTEDFIDAIVSEDPDAGDDTEGLISNIPFQRGSHRLSRAPWSAMLALAAAQLENPLLADEPRINLDVNAFKGSLEPASPSKDCNCWEDPGGKGFMVRGRTYTRDNLKIPGGEPVLKLLAVDWYKSAHRIDLVARHPQSIVRTEAGKKLPFVLIVNLQVPAKPNYSLVFYYAADRSLRPSSLLEKFANGDDSFRNSRFKLIPSIVEGYWVVRRAVGTKACLLGRAVTCHYYRKDNYLEVDVDIGSSSVARGVIGLVLGYVTKIVVDLAIVVEAKDDDELPEYILGTTRVNRISPESAVPFQLG